MASSEINEQACVIEQLIVPSGIGIQSNSSPSLTPFVGALACDVSLPGKLFSGNGSSWVGGADVSPPAVITGITLTTANTGNTNLVNCTLTIQSLNPGVNSMKTFCLQMNQNVATGTPGYPGPFQWVSPAGIVPTDFLPSSAGNPPNYFQSAIFIGGVTYGAYGYILSNGTIYIDIPGASPTVGITSFVQLQGNYI